MPRDGYLSHPPLRIPVAYYAYSCCVLIVLIRRNWGMNGSRTLIQFHISNDPDEHLIEALRNPR